MIILSTKGKKPNSKGRKYGQKMGSVIFSYLSNNWTIWVWKKVPLLSIFKGRDKFRIRNFFIKFIILLGYKNWLNPFSSKLIVKSNKKARAILADPKINNIWWAKYFFFYFVKLQKKLKCLVNCICNAFDIKFEWKQQLYAKSNLTTACKSSLKAQYNQFFSFNKI